MSAPAAGILLVEDNLATRKMLRLTFTTAGYTLHEAADGGEALRLAREHRPQAIIQDLKLPDMDGFELVKSLRALPRGAEIPIFCYSGLIDRSQQKLVLAAGFTDLLLKPASPAELLKIVQAHLSTAPRQPASPFAGRHILVVDDEPSLRKLASLQLAAAGARVTTAEHGHDALAKARVEPPDAILSDVLMPECDGFALCSALRADPALAQIPLVLLSSQYVEPEDRELARKLGANALVVRSGDLQAALAALGESLQQGAPAPGADPASLHAAHRDRLMHQLGRHAGAHAQTAQAQSLYGILSGFLARLGDVQTHTGDLSAKVDDILMEYLNACGYPTGAVYLLEAGAELVPHALVGVSKDAANTWFDFFGNAEVLRAALDENEPLALPSDAISARRAREILQAAQAGSMVLCPLRVDRRPLGVLVLCSKRQSLDPEWLALARAAAGPIGQTIAFARTLTAVTASDQRFRSIADTLADGIVIADMQGRIQYANPAVEQLLGYTAESLSGKPCAELSPLLTTRIGMWAGQALHRDGHPVPVNGSTAVVLDPERPNQQAYAYVIHDLSAHEHLEQLRHLANHDPLTQLYNRRRFDEELHARLAEARRYRVHGALLLLDLDYFKAINDRLGHAAGDAALKAFAAALKAIVRQSDVLARLGGDEFAVLAPYAAADQARAFAAKLLQRLSEQPLSLSGESIRLSASIGIALYSDQFQSAEALLRGADQALYQAKQAGRGCYRLYGEAPEARHVAT